MLERGYGNVGDGVFCLCFFWGGRVAWENFQIVVACIFIMVYSHKFG